MSEILQNYTNELKAMVSEALNILKDPKMSTEQAYIFFLNATESDVSICLGKLTRALPDAFIYKQPGEIKHAIQEDLAIDFINFMAQENMSEESFGDNFVNHIYNTIIDARDKYLSK